MEQSADRNSEVYCQVPLSLFLSLPSLLSDRKESVVEIKFPPLARLLHYIPDIHSRSI